MVGGGGGGSSPGQGVAACGCKIGFNSENKFPVAFFIRHLNEEMSIYSTVSTIYCHHTNLVLKMFNRHVLRFEVHFRF